MWKKYQKDKKVKKNLSLVFFALGLLISLILTAKTFSLFNGFFSSFSQGINSQRNYSWDGKSAVNIAFVQTDVKNASDTKEVSLISLNPKDEKITILHISNLVYTEVPKNYGAWQIGSIYKLGQEENPKIGANLLKLSLMKLTGLPVDGIIITQNNNQNFRVEDQILGLRKNFLTIVPFISSVKTDLNPFELSKLSLSFSSIRADKVVSLDFEKSNVTESKLLPDSSRVLGVDKIRLDTFIRQNLSDSTISEENLSVAVFNATEQPGLAQEASRIITNLGGNVIITSSTENTQKTSSVLIKDEDDAIKDSQTYKRLNQIFAPNCLKQKCFTEDPRINSSRAQINIVLGEDYFDTWHKR